jgi:hypothetical protein
MTDGRRTIGLTVEDIQFEDDDLDIGDQEDASQDESEYEDHLQFEDH